MGTTAELGYGVSLGRPVGTTKQDGYVRGKKAVVPQQKRDMVLVSVGRDL